MRATLATLAALLLSLLVTGACSTAPSGSSSSTTLNVIAGSELKDLQPVLADFQKATGYSLAMHYSGSLDGAQAIASGDQSDLAWFSSGNYLTLLQGKSGRVISQQPVAPHSTATNAIARSSTRSCRLLSALGSGTLWNALSKSCMAGPLQAAGVLPRIHDSPLCKHNLLKSYAIPLPLRGGVGGGGKVWGRA